MFDLWWESKTSVLWGTSKCLFKQWGSLGREAGCRKEIAFFCEEFGVFHSVKYFALFWKVRCKRHHDSTYYEGVQQLLPLYDLCECEPGSHRWNAITVCLPYSDPCEKNWSSQSHWQYTSIHILKALGTSWQCEALPALRISSDFRNYFSFW